MPWQALWAEAQALEFGRGDHRSAAAAYATLVDKAENKHQGARALVAQARNLVRVDEKAEAILLLTQILDETYVGAMDARGRLVVPNARLMTLELMGGPEHEAFATCAARMRGDLESYERPVMSSSQRRFLMKRFLELEPDAPPFPTYQAELPAAGIGAVPVPGDGAVRRSQLAGYWQVRAPRGRLLALFEEQALIERLEKLVNEQAGDRGASLGVLPPGSTSDRKGPTESLTLDNKDFPGWRLVLHPGKGGDSSGVAGARITAYYLIAALVLLAVVVVIGFLARYHRLQMRLTRMKNDLVATVTHEL